VNGVSVVSIRRAQAADSDVLRAIWQESVTAFVKADPRYQLAPDAAAQWETSLRRWLAQDTVMIFVAEREGKVLGYIIGALADNQPGLLPARYGYVSDLAVDFHAKTGGVGRALLEKLKAWFLVQGVSHIEARVPYRHPVAQAFWRAIGASKVYEQMWLKLEQK
jgi:GNAT superfamily N-acetyltransferase